MKDQWSAFVGSALLSLVVAHDLIDRLYLVYMVLHFLSQLGVYWFNRLNHFVFVSHQVQVQSGHQCNAQHLVIVELQFLLKRDYTLGRDKHCVAGVVFEQWKSDIDVAVVVCHRAKVVLVY